MQDVELVDGPDRALDGHVAVAPQSTGKLRWWLTGAVALLVVMLGAAQWVIRSHENAAIARLAAVEGVVAEVDGPLDVDRRYSTAEDSEAFFGQHGGELTRGSDGSLTYQWGAGTDDDPGWSKQLLGPIPTLAGAYTVDSDNLCLPDAAPDADVSRAPRVVCLVTDGGLETLRGGRSGKVPATVTFIEVLDTADGALLAQWSAPGAQTFAMLDGQVVVGVAGPDADIVTSRDPLTGDVRWTHEVPLRGSQVGADLRSRTVSVSRAGDLLALRTSSGELGLLSPDGDVIRDGLGADGQSSWDWQVGPDGGLVLESRGADGNASVTLLAADAGPDADHTLPGSLTPVGVDDGSVPDVLLTADSTLHAWDATTGSERWSSNEASTVALGRGELSALVVRGRVYVLSPAGVAALDGRTGKTLWRVQPGKHQVPTTLFTDARHLLVGYESPAHSADPQIVAYDFAKGEEASRTAYPSGIDHLEVWDGKLLGYDADYTEFAVLG